MDRRQMLSALPLMGAAVATLPATASPSPASDLQGWLEEGEILPIFRKWFAAYCAACDTTEDEAGRLLAICSDCEKSARQIVPRTAAEFAAKLVMETSFGDFCLEEHQPGGPMQDARALLGVWRPNIEAGR